MFVLGNLIYTIIYWENRWCEYENGFWASQFLALGLVIVLGLLISKRLWNLQHNNREILRIIATALLNTYSNERV